MALIAGLLLLLKLGLLGSWCTSCLGMFRCCGGGGAEEKGRRAPKDLREGGDDPRRGGRRGRDDDDDVRGYPSSRSPYPQHPQGYPPHLSQKHLGTPLSHGSSRPVVLSPSVKGRSAADISAHVLVSSPDSNEPRRIGQPSPQPQASQSQWQRRTPPAPSSASFDYLNGSSVFENPAHRQGHGTIGRPLHQEGVPSTTSTATRGGPLGQLPPQDVSSGAWFNASNMVRGTRSSLIRQIEAIKAAVARPSPREQNHSPGGQSMSNPLFHQVS